MEFLWNMKDTKTNHSAYLSLSQSDSFDGCDVTFVFELRINLFDTLA